MWERIYTSVVNVLDINQATLSGSSDIICVKRLNKYATSGSLPKYIYKSTPFHIRFGKTKLLKSREKVVSVYVNGILSNLSMQLSSAGEAYFPHDTDYDDELSDNESARSLTFSSLESSDHLSSKCDEIQETPSYEYSKPKLSIEEVYQDKNPSHNDLESETSNNRCIDCQKTLILRNPNIAKRSSTSINQNGSKKDVLSSDGESVNVNTEKSTYLQSNYRYDTDPMWNLVDIPMNQTREENLLQVSLCGHLIFNERDSITQSQIFSKHIVTWEAFNSDPSILYDPNLVACFGSRPPYYQSKIAMAVLISWIVYNRPLTPSAFDMILKTDLDKPKQKYWDILFRRQNKSTSNANDSINTENNKHVYNNRSHSPYSGIFVRSNKKKNKFRQSFTPTSEQLESLNLNPGRNVLTFVVQSALQGIQSVKAILYLWPHDAKIVISDVDGTITRSNVLGHLMPIMGKDWSHAGVAGLFSNISQNSYKVLYLTARAIGQSSYTREYLFGLTQNKSVKLPDGPLFLSPDRLLSSLKREVITKSAYIFKISILNDIRSVFPPEHNPFYAGFGNNDSDRRAYTSVGVPEFRIFTINPKGEIRTSNSTYQRTYASMTEIVQEMFPVPTENASINEDQYNAFQYWNFPLQMELVHDLDGDYSWNENEAFNQMAP